jgi:hypothetical protein
MSSRQEMLRLMIQATDTLRAALERQADDEYEVRVDGTRVRKDRWQVGIRRIVALLWGNRKEFEIDEVVAAVRALVPQPFAEGDDEALVRAVLAQIKSISPRREPEQEPAYSYAKQLSEAIWSKHYKDIAPHWKPLDDLIGVLTQIDNMTAGLAPPRREWQGLTEEEGEQATGWSVEHIEAKLKEKNQ